MWSGVRAGLAIITVVPADAADVAKGSFGFLDLVFFHGVAWPLVSRDIAGVPRRALLSLEGGGGNSNGME